ncbi:hypothetical protein [Qipengyuania sp. JC766]|uniref:hypothetical protein n=1 Tax=Qipengyuania sp. JC766 TaxID=3232139 RepID=UPI003458AC5B
MDGNLLVIFGSILLMLLIVMPAAYLFQKQEAAHKERKLELQARAAEAKVQEARFSNGDYSRMEERVRVLERIVTENRSDLAGQIEQLRDLDAIEDRTRIRQESAQ